MAVAWSLICMISLRVTATAGTGQEFVTRDTKIVNTAKESSVTLTCLSLHNATEITWYKNGCRLRILADSTSPFVNSSKISRLELQLDANSTEDYKGNYTCCSAQKDQTILETNSCSELPIRLCDSIIITQYGAYSATTSLGLSEDDSTDSIALTLALSLFFSALMIVAILIVVSVVVKRRRDSKRRRMQLNSLQNWKGTALVDGKSIARQDMQLDDLERNDSGDEGDDQSIVSGEYFLESGGMKLEQVEPRDRWLPNGEFSNERIRVIESTMLLNKAAADGEVMNHNGDSDSFYQSWTPHCLETIKEEIGE